MPEIIYSDEYTGPRFTYGLNYRPVHPSHVPPDYILFSGKDHPNHPNFGTIDYPRELTQAEVEAFQLTPIKKARS